MEPSRASESLIAFNPYTDSPGGPMDVIFAIIADSAKVEDGKLNISGIFSCISSTAFPALHHEFVLVVRFAIPSVEFSREKAMRLAIVGPGGREAFVAEGKLEAGVRDKSKAVPPRIMIDQIIPFQNVVFPEPGAYALHIVAQDETKATVPITLALVEKTP